MFCYLALHSCICICPSKSHNERCILDIPGCAVLKLSPLESRSLACIIGGAMERAVAGAAQGAITQASGSHAMMMAVVQSQVHTCPATCTSIDWVSSTTWRHPAPLADVLTMKVVALQMMMTMLRLEHKAGLPGPPGHQQGLLHRALTQVRSSPQ